MRHKYYLNIITLIVIIATWQVFSFIHKEKYTFYQTTQTQNIEGQLANGQKIFLSEVSRHDLSELPEISDIISERIILAKEDLIRTKNLEIIKGIGPVKAKKLNQYLILE